MSQLVKQIIRYYERVPAMVFWKHKLHAYTFLAFKIPTGMCVGCCKHGRGFQPDLDIIPSRADFHKCDTKKNGDEVDFDDYIEVSDDYDVHWAVFLDNGYRE